MIGVIIWLILIFIIACCAAPGFLPFLLIIIGSMVAIYIFSIIIHNYGRKIGIAILGLLTFPFIWPYLKNKKEEVKDENQISLTHEEDTGNTEKDRLEKLAKIYCQKHRLDFISLQSNILTLIDRSEENKSKKITARIEPTREGESIIFKEMLGIEPIY